MLSTSVGYCNGSHPNPTYEDVCSGTTGHAEVVQVCGDGCVWVVALLQPSESLLKPPESLLKPSESLLKPPESLLEPRQCGCTLWRWPSWMHTCDHQVTSPVPSTCTAHQVLFDPAQVGYEALLDVFFNNHDPTQENRQGNDVGTQYRSGARTTRVALRPLLYKDHVKGVTST